MRYTDGQEVMVGDVVKLGAEDGVVVCLIDRSEYSEGFTREAWSYLERGVLIDFQNLGLIHYSESETDLKLVSRKMG